MRLEAMSTMAESDVQAWRALAERAAEPNPFFAPDYALPLAREVGDGELLVVGDWVACLPVTRPRTWHQAPLPIVATWRPHALYSLLGTPLIDRDRLDEGARGLVEALHALRPLAALEWLDADGVVCAALRRAAPEAYEFERFERASVVRRPEPTYLDETVSAKHLREYRRQRRKLGEDLGEVVIRDRSGDPAAIEGLIAMEAASGVAEPIASDAAVAAFFREAARSAQLLELSAGGTPLAYKCNLAAGDGLFMLKIAFDADRRRFSPGMLLELEMLDFFHAAPTLKWMDSCADANNTMINRLWPDRRTLVTLAVAAPGLRGRAARGAVQVLRAARDKRNEGT